MAALVAVIRRVPGRGFMKGPRTMMMPAVPVHTNSDNLTTYFSEWPKHKSQFLLYGSRRGIQSLAPFRELPGARSAFDGVQAKSKSNGGSQNIEDEDTFHLYGPGSSAPAPSLGEPTASGVHSTSGGGAPDGGSSKKRAAASTAASSNKPLGLAGMMRRFQGGQKLTMVTAYDFPSARVARAAGVELILVGDSIGNCRLGLPDTVGVTMEDMLRATAAVRRGIDAPPNEALGPPQGPKPVLIGDMPFGSYLLESEALKNAAAFRMAGADMVKLEGGRQVAKLVRAFTDAGIAVMGHVGLEPQSALLQGGLRQQGTTAEAAFKIVQDAMELAAAGAVALVIECVPTEVGRAVQAAVPSVPVIGIGAGGDVAGQVLVCDDLLGVHGAPPSFAKRYADLAKASAEAYAQYTAEVREGAFPAPSHRRNMKATELAKLAGLMPQVGVTDFQAAPPAEEPQVAAPQPQASPLPASFIFEELALPPRPMVPSPNNGATWVKLGKSPKGADQWTFNAFRNFPMSQVLEIRNGSFAQCSTRALSQLSGGAATAAGGMQVLPTLQQLRDWRSSAGEVAFVPTMGNLHEGHLELIDEAKLHAKSVLVSIFVNPAQFAAHEDLDKYPRTMERDLELLRERGVNAVFTPAMEDLYPHGVPGGTVVVPEFVKHKSEDAARPHFFKGVATVCLKLFNASEPDVVVFGQKDAMQCVVIGRMLEDLLLSHRTKLVVAPTSREADGLARSSRNSYLTPGMRLKAPAIHATLTDATTKPNATPGSVRAEVQQRLESEGMEVQYVSVADPREMDEKADDAPLANSIVSIACLLNDGQQQCRLIDNLVVPEASEKQP